MSSNRAAEKTAPVHHFDFRKKDLLDANATETETESEVEESEEDS